MWTGESYPYFMVIFPMSILTLVILSILFCIFVFWRHCLSSPLNSRWNVFYLNDKVMFVSKRKGYNHPKLFKKILLGIKNMF